jgi:hypothetical protein
MSAFAGTLGVAVLSGVISAPINDQRQILMLATRPGIEGEVFLPEQRIAPWAFAGAYVNTSQTRVDFMLAGVGAGCDFYWSSLSDKPQRRVLTNQSLAMTVAVTVGALPFVSGKYVVQPMPVSLRIGATWH